MRSLNTALDALQARLDAGDTAGARSAYDTFENVWFSVEDGIRASSGGSYRAIEDAMRSLRDAVYLSAPDPARARDALADVRGQINAFATQAGIAPSSAGTVAPGASGASTAAASVAPVGGAPASVATASASPEVSTEDCARYSGRAALPYFNYALSLANNAPLPGIPPAQAVTPIYGYGPSPLPGTVAAGPYRPVFPYAPPIGPGAFVGGSGYGAGNPALAARALTAGFVVGGQLAPLPNPALAALGPADILGLAGQQATEIGNRIAAADAQQSLVGNQLGYSDLRSTWVGTYLSMSEQARDIALSLCGRIPG